ncbi:uncharacterized protein [Physcomitrium patens]|uniref:BZIP domain-containing protein n=1 Tax=Physcomitrium patens TaxID=3218 RepID=A9SDH1_PHYPA|nr:uncharacterized protein LOC112293994 isoform X2 [Physcomitrium patens]PNR36579.1 hypothetical protein PHYPA_022430 [Physcomitrium patens]|eukprot:XP_024399812.1 uncharacterized protein LOC112293994 isoform X2 [Physcomitrella patens]
MCHGLIEERARICVPDLLRGFLNQDQPDYETHVDDSTSVYGNGSTSTLPDSSGLSDNTLVDMVNDYSTVVRKLDSEDVDDMEADAIASTGSLSTWFDCIKDDFCTAPKAVPTKSSLLVVKLSHQDASDPVAAAPKSRKTRKSALTEGRNHAVHDSEMDGVAPLLVDEKRKRRMSSNRASAQRSRQRKQKRLDELEILTAQLRLENATLSRRSKIAEQLAKNLKNEKNELAIKFEKLKKELEAARQPCAQGSPDSSNPSGIKSMNSSICNMDEGVAASSWTCVEQPKDNPRSVLMTLDDKKQNISSTDVSRGTFQELYDPIDLNQFDGVGVPDLLQEGWYGSFTECLNA